MIRFICQHCNLPNRSEGSQIPVICRFCENLGHKGFKSDCEKCKNTTPPSGKGTPTGEALKKAA